MKNKIAKLTMLIAGLVFINTGCRKSLDINTNPNVANDVNVQLLLPSVEVGLATNMGVDFQTYGSIWGQYWTQNPNSSQYRSLERYQPTSPDFDRSWQNLYAGVGTDLVQLERKAITTNQKQYRAIAILLKAYMFQVITDAWGDVPYSEALRGDDASGGILSPKYDAQASIYNSLIAQVDSAKALIDLSDPTVPGGDDLIFNGDMNSWLKFANTLQLKMLLRLSERDPAKAQAGIAALNGAAFLESGDNARIAYTSTAGNKNPLYAEAVGVGSTQNLVASATVIDSMVSDNDPRIGVFFDTTNDGTYVGIAQGDYDAAVSPGAYSIPSYRVGGDVLDNRSATAPVYLMTGYESLYLQAEAVARGWLTSTGTAKSLFESGIQANFATWGLSSADAATYIASSYWGIYPTGGGVAAQVRHIVTQKWFSMTGNQGFEAWTEWRRTGYPEFFTLSVNAQLSEFPARFLYPDVEITRNANFPGTKPVTAKVYWDVN